MYATDAEALPLSVQSNPGPVRRDPSLPWKLSTIVLAVIAATAITLAASLGHGSGSSTAPGVSTELMLDFGNPSVDGYTCGMLQPTPCHPIGGRCTDGLQSTCKCHAGYSGQPCDWGPFAQPSTVPAYLNDQRHTQEELARIRIAYDFSNAVYSNLSAPDSDARKLCPRFFGEGSTVRLIEAVSADADTHVGAYVIAPEHSPSGQAEVVLGFRGTEFSTAIEEIAECAITDVTCSFRALKTVLTDLNIGRQDLNWTAPDGTDVDLGYVHKGFFSAVAPFLDYMLPELAPFLKRAAALNPPGVPPVINLVGHSLGGALANLFASVLRVVVPNAKLFLTTFGSPRVGSALWVRNLEADNHTRILRVVNADDVISLVPTSVGFGDSVLHAGKQLTVGWQRLSDQCRESGLKEMKSMYQLLEPSWGKQRECAVSSVSELHLNYGPNLESFLEEQGFEGKRWCQATKDVKMAF